MWPIIIHAALHKSDMCLEAMLVSQSKMNIFSSKCMVTLHTYYSQKFRKHSERIEQARTLRIFSEIRRKVCLIE